MPSSGAPRPGEVAQAPSTQEGAERSPAAPHEPGLAGMVQKEREPENSLKEPGRSLPQNCCHEGKLETRLRAEKRKEMGEGLGAGQGEGRAGTTHTQMKGLRGAPRLWGWGLQPSPAPCMMGTAFSPCRSSALSSWGQQQLAGLPAATLVWRSKPKPWPSRPGQSLCAPSAPNVTQAGFGRQLHGQRSAKQKRMQKSPSLRRFVPLAQAGARQGGAGGGVSDPWHTLAPLGTLLPEHRTGTELFGITVLQE